MPPDGVWRSALSSRLRSTRCSRSGSARDARRIQIAVQPFFEADVAFGRRRVVRRDRLRNQLRHVHRHAAQPNRAAVDLAQLEQVVDQPTQVLRLLQDQPQIALHVGRARSPRRRPAPRPWRASSTAACAGRARRPRSARAGPLRGRVRGRTPAAAARPCRRTRRPADRSRPNRGAPTRAVRSPSARRIAARDSAPSCDGQHAGHGIGERQRDDCRKRQQQQQQRQVVGVQEHQRRGGHHVDQRHQQANPVGQRQAQPNAADARRPPSE